MPKKKQRLSGTQASLMPGVVPDVKLKEDVERVFTLHGWKEAKNPLVVLNLSGGRQSTIMWLMIRTGFLDVHVDYSIYAETGSEAAWVYEQLDFVERMNELLPGRRIPIIKVAKRNSFGVAKDAFFVTARWKLKEDNKCYAKAEPDSNLWFWRTDAGETRWIGPPAWTDSGAPLTRTCTTEYKIIPSESATRSLMEQGGYQSVIQLRGHSMTDAKRAKDDTRKQWYTRWPLIENQFDDKYIKEWAIDEFAYEFRWSACYCCPFILRDPWRVRDLWLYDRSSLLKAAVTDHELRENIPRVKTHEAWLAGPGKPLSLLAWLHQHEEDERWDEYEKSKTYIYETFGEKWANVFFHGLEDPDSQDIPLLTQGDMAVFDGDVLINGLFGCASGECGT